MKGLCCGCIVVAAVASAELHHRNPPLPTDNSLLHPAPSGCRRCHLSIAGRGWPIVKFPRPLSVRRPLPKERLQAWRGAVRTLQQSKCFYLSDVVKT
eukprot:scaffold10302_cov70-Skeletonema_dohrnii-CCMP3373.AAC.1